MYSDEKKALERRLLHWGGGGGGGGRGGKSGGWDNYGRDRGGGWGLLYLLFIF